MLDLLAAVEFGGKLVESGFGIRYLVSPSYRRRTHQRWSELSGARVAYEIFEMLIAFGVLAIVLYFLFSVIRR